MSAEIGREGLLEYWIAGRDANVASAVLVKFGMWRENNSTTNHTMVDVSGSDSGAVQQQLVAQVGIEQTITAVSYTDAEYNQADLVTHAKTALLNGVQPEVWLRFTDHNSIEVGCYIISSCEKTRAHATESTFSISLALATANGYSYTEV